MCLKKSTILLLIISCSGCVGLGTITKTNNLRQGMTQNEVKRLLGSPLNTQFEGDYLVWKYSLHQYFVGWVPYYLTFDKNNMALLEWHENKEEYYQDQQRLFQAAQQISETNKSAHTAYVEEEPKKDIYKEAIDRNNDWYEKYKQGERERQEDYQQQQRYQDQQQYQAQQLYLQKQQVELYKQEVQQKREAQQQAYGAKLPASQPRSYSTVCNSSTGLGRIGNNGGYSVECSTSPQ